MPWSLVPCCTVLLIAGFLSYDSGQLVPAFIGGGGVTNFFKDTVYLLI